mmetsp:Transcript_63592/g.185973  ORF Transcript_63592/g.185973 Transcript_63592/m.185973 type:complete len:647 (+) Transcript_63592:421-2361(+)
MLPAHHDRTGGVQWDELGLPVDRLVHVPVIPAESGLQCLVRVAKCVGEADAVRADGVAEGVDALVDRLQLVVVQDLSPINSLLADQLQERQLLQAPHCHRCRCVLDVVLHCCVEVARQDVQAMHVRSLVGHHVESVQRLVEALALCLLSAEPLLEAQSKAPGTVRKEVHERGRLASCTLHVKRRSRFREKVCGGADGRLSGAELAHGLDDEAGGLHAEDHLLALARDGHAEVGHDVAQARGPQEALAAAGPAHVLHAFVRVERRRDLQSGTGSVQLRKLVSCRLIAIGNGLLHPCQVVIEPAPIEGEHVSKGERLECPVLLHLVVHDGMLARGQGILRLRVLESLTADTGVANGYCGCLAQGVARHVDEGHTRAHHGDVLELAQLWRSRNVLALARNLLVLRKHVEPWDPDVVESRVADVVMLGVKLWANLPNLNSRHASTLIIPELHEESVEAVVDTIDDELCHDHAVGTSIDTCRPPLHRRQRGRVDHELVRRAVERRRGLQGADVRAVAQLGLRVGAQEAAVQGPRQPRLLLLLGRLRPQEGQEHAEVDPEAAALQEAAHLHAPALVRELELGLLVDQPHGCGRSLVLDLVEVQVAPEGILVSGVEWRALEEALETCGLESAPPGHGLAQRGYVKRAAGTFLW